MADTALNNSSRFTVGEKEYTMKFTFNAMFRAEPQLTTKSLMATLAKFADSSFAMKDVFILFKECVRAGTPEMRDKPAKDYEKLWEDMVAGYGMENVILAVTMAIVASGIFGSKKEMAEILAATPEN